MNNGLSKISNVKMPDEICNGQWPSINVLHSPHLCVVFILWQGKCRGWLQYMYIKYFLVLLLPLLPNMHNFINWIKKVYGKKENQYVKGEVQNHKVEEDYSSWNQFDQNVSRYQEILASM